MRKFFAQNSGKIGIGVLSLFFWTSIFALGYLYLAPLYNPLLPPKAQEAQAVLGDARAVYGDSTLASPNQIRTRTYTGSSNSWTGESTTSQTTGTTIRHEVVRYAPTRSEALAGVWEQSGSGSTLRVFRWNGSTWSTEWSTTTANTTLGNNVRPFDIEYERSSGDAIVVYSTAAATTDELAYRTWNGTTWVGPTNFNVVGTTALVCGVEMQNRPSSDRIAMIYSVSATTNSANAAVWNGSGWESNPSTPLETGALEAGTACSFKNFDIAWEETSGEILAAWGRNAVLVWAYSACTGGPPCTWGATATAGTEDGTVLDMATQPGTNNIGISVSGNGGTDMGGGFWNGTSWSSTATPDAGAGTLVAGDGSVGVGWLTNGGTTKGVLIYADLAEAGVDYTTIDAGVVNVTETQCGTTPGAFLERQVKVVQDPSSTSQFLVLVENANSDLFAIRFTMDGAGAVTCADTNGGVALNANLTSVTSGSFDFDYELFIPVVAPDATSYTNGTDSTLNFSACATTGCGGRPTQSITVTGTNFGAACSSPGTVVKIGTTEIPCANVSSWAATSITFTVPNTLDLPDGGTGASGLIVRAGGTDDSTPLEFWVFPSALTVVAEGRVGDSLVITGREFGATGTFGTACSAARSVCVGSTDATETAWSDTSITFTVPNDAGVDVNIQVRAANGKTSPTATFKILPNVTSLSGTPQTNAAREYNSTTPDADSDFTINGNHFGTWDGADQPSVTASGTALTILDDGACGTAGGTPEWTDTCIKVRVPEAFTDSTYPTTLIANRTTGTGESAASPKTDSQEFYILPRIRSVSPAAASAAVAVTLSGDHLCGNTNPCPTSGTKTLDNNMQFNPTGDDTNTNLDCDDDPPDTGQTDPSALCAYVETADFLDDAACGTGAGTIEWTSTCLKARVPADATLAAGSRPIRTEVTGCGTGATCRSNSIAFSKPTAGPDDPSALQQYRSDETTVIPDDGSTNEATVVVKATMTDDQSGTLCLEVERQAVGTGFTNTPNFVQDGVPAGEATCPIGTSVTGEVYITGLATGNYKWQARVKRNDNTTFSNWVEFESGAVEERDFQVDVAYPGIVYPGADACADAVIELGATTAKIKWSTDEIALVSANASSVLQLDDSPDFSSPIPESGMDNERDATTTGGTSHEVSISGLTSGTTYYWRVRSADLAGNYSCRAGGAKANCTSITHIGAPYCSFAAGARIAKTIKRFIPLAATTVASPAQTCNTTSFSITIPEAGMILRNAYVELFGQSGAILGNTQTFAVELQRGDAGASCTAGGEAGDYVAEGLTHTIETGNQVTPFTALYNVYDSAGGNAGPCANCETVNNLVSGAARTYTLHVKNLADTADANLNLLSGVLVLVYDFLP